MEERAVERGVLHVTSRPKSPETEDEYNTWYDEVHMPEICALPGFTGGRRFAPVQDDGPYVALYSIEGPDLEAVMGGLLQASQSGELTMADVLETTPAPQMRLLRLTAEHDPDRD
ncbi:hypothetical protein AB0L71_23795 [Streptomyces sp. NPDC052052]|uniref:hypothetical protein n=1 Tax=Streptomyces sp. NPDC052052 TaxID=3154756 RepID=UPI00342D037C